MAAVQPLCTTWREVENTILRALLALPVPIAVAEPATPRPLSPLGAIHRENLAAPVHASMASNCDAVTNTLRYLFVHMRCGILVCLRKGSLVLFAPFANAAYRNTWSQFVVFGAEANTSAEQYAAAKSVSTRHAKENWLPLRAWWMNGGIVCNVMPKDVWGDAHCAEIMEMIQATCAAHPGLPDCDFFINKRDYPQLRKDGSEPYQRFTGVTKLAREVYSAYAPVVSFYGGTEFADCMMPLTEDWKRVRSMEGSARTPDATAWAATQQRAVWRGTATGNGVTPVTNARLLLITHCNYPGRQGLYDVALVGCNLRDKIVATRPGCMQLGWLDPSRVVLQPFLPLDKQVETYRYVLYVDGHCAANRYGALMHSQRTILRVASTREADGGCLWLFPFLTPAVITPDGTANVPADADHFLIASDLCNADATVRYLQAHDDVAWGVACNAFIKAPTRSTILHAWAELLHEIHAAQALLPEHVGTGAVLFSPYDARYAKVF
jgi:hypothetical protein